MWIDAICLISILVWALLGARTGLVIQITRIVAVVTAGALAKSLAPVMAVQASAFASMPYLVAVSLAGFVVFLAAWLSITFSAKSLMRAIRSDVKPLAAADRIVGSLVGASKASAVVYLTLCGIVIWEAGSNTSMDAWGHEWQDSKAKAWAKQYNVITDHEAILQKVTP